MHSFTRQLAQLTCAALIALGGASWAQASASHPLLAQGDALWAAGKPELAQKSYEDAVAAQPKSFDARMKLGGLQLSQQAFTAATDTYKQAIGLNANNAKAWVGLGFSYLHSDRKDLTLAAFNEAIRLDPSYKDRLATLMVKLAVN
jgi:tetratricopeptide (TPR) repeat protein